MHQDWRTRCFLKLLKATHVIDVGMSGHNVFHLKLVLLKDRADAINFISRINDNSLVSGLVTQNRAIASQHTNRKNVVNHQEYLSLQKDFFRPS
jgi:hypothetical protein